MKLAIVSHTPHYESGSEITGWGPTVREINHLTELFEEIYHVAPLHNEPPPESSLSYQNEKIKFVGLKPYGGEKLSDKISILTTAFSNLKTIDSVLKKVDWVQFRAPTAMGIYVLPYISLRKKPKRWVKYAGNWNMENAPISYLFQKWWLQKNFLNSKVTINGNWKGLPDHILDFQNPCLDNDELKRASEVAKGKNFDSKLTICFVGTLTRNKGVDIILEALEKENYENEICEVVFCGDGSEKKDFESLAEKLKVKTRFTGSLQRKELESVYSASHLILLPSQSEGFPKVIAEASAYGCVPIVSDVSSIGQYYNGSNGFLLKKINSQELREKMDEALKDRKALKLKSLQCLNVAKLFTFEHYMKNLKEKVLSS